AVFGVDGLASGFQVFGIDVTGCYDLSARFFEETLNIVPALPAGPDAGYRDAITRSNSAVAPQNGRRHNGRKASDRGTRHRLQKVTSSAHRQPGIINCPPMILSGRKPSGSNVSCGLDAFARFRAVAKMSSPLDHPKLG